MPQPSKLEDVLEHLRQLGRDPHTKADDVLLRQGLLLLTDDLDKDYTTSIAVEALDILPTFTSDPSVLARLIIQATSRLTFSEIISLNNDTVNLVAGLHATDPSINELAISFVNKASDSPGDAAIIAGLPQVLASLVRLWLMTPETGIADKAQSAILSLLRVDDPQDAETVDTLMSGDPSPGHASGQGLVWRRLFADRDVYYSLFEICSLKTVNRPDQPTKSHKSVAQGRLMDFLPKVGVMNWHTISTTQFPEFEKQLDCQGGGVLEFAACHMIEEGDILMMGIYFTFLEHLIRYFALESRLRQPLLRTEPETWSSPPLDFLISKGLHNKVISFYLEPSKTESFLASYTLGPAAKYLSTYSSLYPKHLQNDQMLLKMIFNRLSTALSVSTADWARGAVPHNDILVLQSLPRATIVALSQRPESPLFKLRTNPPSVDAFHALATLFRGPKDVSSQSVGVETESDHLRYEEAVAARQIFLLYLRECPEFWANVTGASDLLAMKTTAVAAVKLLEAIMSANWSLRREGEGITLADIDDRAAKSGLWALLESGSALDALLRRQQMHSEDATAIQNARYDALLVMLRLVRIEKEQSNGANELLNEIFQVLVARVKEGPWGSVSAAPRVDAMEQ